MDIEIKNLSFSYKKKVKKEKVEIQVLNHLSFNLAGGKIYSLLGESGSGKTTLLRCLAGLEEKYTGEIYLNGNLLSPMERKKGSIAYISQEFALYPHMTVYDNLAFPLKIEGAGYDEVEERVMRMASILKMTPFLSRKPKELSIGQQQKVAFGRAAIRMCSLFLFDEPFSNLDSHSVEEMKDFLREMHEVTTSTFVFSTHSVEDALSLSDEVIVLSKEGTLAQKDTPKEIYLHPKNEEVKRLINSAEAQRKEMRKASGR